MTDPACKDCRFYQPSASNPNSISGPWGQCRYNPPIIMGDVTTPSRNGWPTVGEDTWCGKFESKPEPQPEPMLMINPDAIMTMAKADDIKPNSDLKQRLESAQEDAEPAQTDWEADRVATHNARYAERARLAQNALRQRVGYQEIVAQVGMAMATLSFPVFLGIPICRPGEKFFHFHGELWEFLSRPPNQSGIWLVDTEGGFPPGPYQLRWENDRWYSDGELPKWPRA